MDVRKKDENTTEWLYLLESHMKFQIMLFVYLFTTCFIPLETKNNSIKLTADYVFVSQLCKFCGAVKGSELLFNVTRRHINVRKKTHNVFASHIFRMIFT